SAFPVGLVDGSVDRGGDRLRPGRCQRVLVVGFHVECHVDLELVDHAHELVLLGEGLCQCALQGGVEPRPGNAIELPAHLLRLPVFHRDEVDGVEMLDLDGVTHAVASASVTASPAAATSSSTCIAPLMRYSSA